jgi:hypothetical protein
MTSVERHRSPSELAWPLTGADLRDRRSAPRRLRSPPLAECRPSDHRFARASKHYSPGPAFSTSSTRRFGGSHRTDDRCATAAGEPRPDRALCTRRRALVLSGRSTADWSFSASRRPCRRRSACWRERRLRPERGSVAGCLLFTGLPCSWGLVSGDRLDQGCSEEMVPARCGVHRSHCGIQVAAVLRSNARRSSDAGRDSTCSERGSARTRKWRYPQPSSSWW